MSFERSLSRKTHEGRHEFGAPGHRARTHLTGGRHHGRLGGRGDGIDPDAEVLQLVGEIPGQRSQGTLGGAVGRHHAEARRSARGHVDDDPPALLRFHLTCRMGAHVDSAQDVDLHHPPGEDGVLLGETVDRVQARVVDQPVDAAEGIYTGRDNGRGLLPVGHRTDVLFYCASGIADGRGDLLARGSIDVVDDNGRPFPGYLLGVGPAQPLAGTRDDDPLPFELHVALLG